MENAVTTRPYSVWLMLASGFFERMGHYGFRAIFVIYMTGSIIAMERMEALEYYGLFTTGLLLVPVLGGILGDLFIGNKNAAKIGLVLKAIGLLIISNPDRLSLFIGLFILTLGEGFYKTNFFAYFGKYYLNRKHLLYAGFLLLMAVINIGAFLGPYTSTLLSEKNTYALGFQLTAVCFILSLIGLQFAKYPMPETDALAEKPKPKYGWVVAAFLLLGFFWTSINAIDISTQDLVQQIAELKDLMPGPMLPQALNAGIIAAASIGAAVLFYIRPRSNPHIMMLSFGLGTVGLLLFALLFNDLLEINAINYLSALVFIGCSEAILTPVIFSVVCTQINPRYFASILSLISFPARIGTSIFTFFVGYTMMTDDSVTLIVLCTLFAVIAIALFIYSRSTTSQVINEGPLA